MHKFDFAMNKHFLGCTIFFISTQVYPQDLPGRHQLVKNDLGEYYIVNNENLTMIEPSILKFGFNGKWILACIENKSIDSDLKRWVFVDIKSGGAYDSINKQNWMYFSEEAFPELKNIKLNNLSGKDCP